MSVFEILKGYTNNEMTAEEANKEMRRLGVEDFHIDPNRNEITEEEKRRTTVGCYPDMANGFGLLDTGTGSMDKVEVRNGKLVDMDCGEMYALLIICGRAYHINGVDVVE